jgi:nicotinamidase-related amidase
VLSALPPAVYVPRKGAVNALDDEDFVKTIRATGRKTLIMAGVWTDVCVMFPALDARWQGCVRRDGCSWRAKMESRTAVIVGNSIRLVNEVELGDALG